MSTPKRKKKTMMTITLMIASTTLPDTLPDLPWLKTASNMKMIRWWYNHHEDEKYIEVYESVENF
ncbi:hypothetical protein [Faecalibacillus intestinalis]|uniref:hypothetical protein n=1 Tax=Faecalibacillus intestinalis TaxID=1982626 RepID=UPI00352292EA